MLHERTKPRFLASIGVALMLSGWHAGAAEPQPQPDPAAFARGAKTWADNCARCHNMRDPRELRDDQWRAVVTHMRLRAGLTGEQARDILLFLQESN